LQDVAYARRRFPGRQPRRSSDPREAESHRVSRSAAGAEIEERERNTIERRIREAHLPRVKTLEEFDYTQYPQVTAAEMRDLGEGGYIDRAEPVLFIGECDPATFCTPRYMIENTHYCVGRIWADGDRLWP
jgi:hypothetical protein